MSMYKNTSKDRKLLDEVRDVMRLHPVVMTREEVAQIIALMEGVPQLIVKLLYGSGLRIMETVRLRILRG